MEGLNELLLQISNELGVGIDFLKANFIEILPEIGRYLFIKDLVTNTIFWLVTGIFFTMPVVLATAFYYNEILEWESDEKDKKDRIKLFKLNILFYISIQILSLISTFIPYLASPKFWTIQKLLEIVK